MATASGGAPRTIVYVDAFNLYFGALKNSSNKWLNLEQMSKLLLPGNDITAIKYFTAKVSARPNDPQQPVRQQTYFRALSTLPCAKIIYGHYLTHTVRMRLANPITDSAGQVLKYVDVVKTEEKGSDVNLAVQLLNDAHLDLYDVAVVVSNDSDLLAPIKIVRNVMKKKVGVLNPHKNSSRAIQPNVDFYKQIRSGVLAASQFPQQMTDSVGTFHKPATW